MEQDTAGLVLDLAAAKTLMIVDHLAEHVSNV